MRKTVIGFALAVALVIIGLHSSPLRTILFPPPLTENQRAILQRAEAGLHLFATKSPVAMDFYGEAKLASWWSRTPIIFSVPNEVANKPGPYAVSVISSNPMKLVAFYFHPTRAICFVESSCDSLGHLALGLTYAHELQHRQDYQRGLINNHDVFNEELARQSEARCKMVEQRILNEFTEGRWLTAVDYHRRLYYQQPAKIRRRYPLGRRAFDVDLAWIRKEFGQAGLVDLSAIRDHLLYGVKFREATAGLNISSDDSLRIAAEVFYGK